MKIQEYSNFRQRIHHLAKIKALPLRAMFEVTYACNFKCKHCYIPHNYRVKERVLSTRKVFSLFDQLKETGTYYLGFTGGEPFMRKDILDILWYAKRRGFELIIYSNGSLIDEEIATELAKLRPNKVDITIPAMTEVVFDRVIGVDGYYDKVFNAIDLLKAHGVNLGFKTCILKENQDEIQDIQKFARSLKALHRLDDVLSPCLDGSQEPYEYRGALKDNNVNSPQSAVHSKSECVELNSKRKRNEKISRHPAHPSVRSGAGGPTPDTLFPCGVGRTQAAVTPFGELKPCLMIDKPRFRIFDTRHPAHPPVRSGAGGPTPDTRNNKDKSGLKKAWEELKKFIAGIKPDEHYKCNTCELEPYCKWCPARGLLHDGAFSSCDPEVRRKAYTLKSSIDEQDENKV